MVRYEACDVNGTSAKPARYEFAGACGRACSLLYGGHKV